MSKYASYDPKPLKLEPEQLAEIAAQIPPVDISGKVDKITDHSLLADTEAAKIHEAHSDDQDLSGKVDKITGSSLVADTEIAKIHSNTLDHSHSNKSTLDSIQEALTTSLKSGYDGAVTHAGSAHAPSGAQVNADITKSEIEAKLTGEITSHTHPATGGSDPWTRIKLASDFVTSLATNENVTGLAFTPAINKTYLIFGYFLLRTATATVGARPGVAWPANLTDATMRMEAANSLTVSALRSWGTTADSHWGSLDGIMITSGTTSGNFQITLATETAGTNVTIKAGSILMYREL